jgi:hypothetical protein
MQGALLLGVYVLTTMCVQFVGFLISYAIQKEMPAAGLLTFLGCFIAAFAIAWPIAVRLTEWGIVKAGGTLPPADADANAGIPKNAGVKARSTQPA